MKNLYYKGTPEHLQTLAEEYNDAGFDTEIVEGELTVFAVRRPAKPKKNQQKTGEDRWSKRERNFGYTRGN